MKNNFIEWNDIYSVGIDVIDKQHQNFFVLINKTYDHVNLSEQELLELLKELQNYAIYHFNTEEKILEATQYPYFSQHQQEHNNFKVLVKQWKDDPKKLYDFELFDFLVDWLVDHIMNTDQKYSNYVKREITNQKIDISKLLCNK